MDPSIQRITANHSFGGGEGFFVLFFVFVSSSSLFNTCGFF